MRKGFWWEKSHEKRRNLEKEIKPTVKKKIKIKEKGRYCVERDQKLFKKAIRIYSKQEKKDRNQSQWSFKRKLLNLMEWYNLLRIPPSAFQALILSFKYVMDDITHFDVVCDVKWAFRLIKQYRYIFECWQ